MEGTWTAEPTGEDAAQMEADIVRMIGLMDEARRQMERDQADIDQIKSETNLLKVEIRAVQADTCALLTTLKAAA